MLPSICCRISTGVEFRRPTLRTRSTLRTRFLHTSRIVKDSESTSVRQLWAQARTDVERLCPPNKRLIMYVNPPSKNALQFLVRGGYLLKHNMFNFFWGPTWKGKATPREMFAYQKLIKDQLRLLLLLFFYSFNPSCVFDYTEVLISSAVMVWLITVRPNLIIPGVLRPPTKEDVSEFIEYVLESHDEAKIGYVSVVRATELLRYLDPNISDADISASLNTAGLSADGLSVNYLKLAVLALD